MERLEAGDPNANQNKYGLDEDAFRSPLNARQEFNFSPEPRGTIGNIKANVSDNSSNIGPAELRRQRFLDAKKALDQQDEAEEQEADAKS